MALLCPSAPALEMAAHPRVEHIERPVACLDLEGVDSGAVTAPSRVLDQKRWNKGDFMHKKTSGGRRVSDRTGGGTRGALLAVLLGMAGLLAMNGATQGAAPGGGTPPAAAAATQAAWPPSREDWEQMQENQQTMQQELNALRGGAATASRPSEGILRIGPPGDLGAAVRSLFEPRTEEEYLSPFEIQNPAHMPPDLHLEIGQWNNLHLDIGVHSVGRFQALEQENVAIGGTPVASLNPGLQNPFASLSFLATIPNMMEVYFDLYIASRPHPNTMYAHEGYLLFKALPPPLDQTIVGEAFKYINVKAGGFDIDFGDGNYHRSNNAFVDRNPLVGNPLVDPNVEELGLEVFAIQGPIFWLAGVGSGTTTEHFDFGAGASGHLKFWGYPLPELRTSASFYYADLSGTTSANEHSNLFAAIRSGGSYSAIFGGGDSPGQVLPAAGRRVFAVQGDITWNHWPWEIYTNVGWTRDADTNGPLAGSPSEEWLYTTIGPVYHITPALYVSARYGVAFASSVHGVPTDGWVDRMQFGAGYWVTRNLLAKIEYVYQQYHEFNAGAGTVSGVDAANSPRFGGLVLEIAFWF
jgi:hypothetical protein